MSTQQRRCEQEEIIRSRGQVDPLLDGLVAAMSAEGYTDEETFGMRLALVEAIDNAIHHGHKGDETRPVKVSYHIDGQQVLADVEDQGPGYDPGKIIDPLSPEGLERTGGRGLFLMKAMTTWIRHNERGNRVTLCKCRKPANASAESAASS